MYRIVVADDEEYVRDLLVKNINQAQKGFEVIGTAKNGLEAVELVKENKPDILITDICMPKLSGLDLIKMVNDLNLNIKTVIISGYDEFAYAKTAMTLGVTEYLLKPFLPDEMFEVLYKIKEELENQANLMRNMQEMQNQIEKNLVHEQERFLKDTILCSQTQENLIQKGNTLQMKMNADYYCVGVLKIRLTKDNIDNDSENYKKMEELLKIVKDEYFNDNIKSYVLNENNGHLVLIFCGSYRSQMLFHKDIQEGIEQLNQSMERYYKSKLWCVLGSAYREFAGISESYKEAMMVWKGFLNQADCTLRYEDYKKRDQVSDITTMQRPQELEKALLLHIQMNRKEKALEELNEILKYYATFPADMMEFVSISLVELVFTISSALMKASGDVKAWEDEKIIDYLKKHFSYGSLMEARLVLEDYVERCCDQFRTIGEKQGDKIVNTVKLLIEHNIDNEDFNLESVSTQLFFSHNYVRQIFKQKTGESFMEYLIRRRMETAGDLLRNSDLKIQEVALKTGYSNQRYFASCFRKFYSNTPTEYREDAHKKNM